MMLFHIAGEALFEFARFLVFAIAVNQPDKCFRVGFAAYQRLYNLYKALGINVADATASNFLH